MKNIAVVSLINEHERRQHIDALFKEYDLEFNYFDAIDKLQVIDTLEEYQLIVNTDRMSTGEVACYLSHYCLWQQVVEQNMPYLMVFEDDIYFAKSAKVLLTQLDWLPSDFDVIKLETMYENVMINKGVSLPLGYRLCQMQSCHMATAGYIVSQAAAKKLIAMTQELGIHRPVDHIIFDKLIEQKTSKVYQVCPALCIQDKIYNIENLKFISVLEEGRKLQPTHNESFSAVEKVSRELIRVWHQLGVTERFHTVLLIVKGYRNRRIDYQE